MTEAAQGWLFRTVSSEAFLITPPSLGISLHLLSSSSNSLLFSSLYFCVSLSPLLTLFLLDCFSLLLIKQGQTGFIPLIQTEGFNTSPTLEKRRERGGWEPGFKTAQEGPHCSGDWAGSTHSKLHTMGVFLGGQEPFLLPRRGHCHQAGTWLAPGRSIQQPWAVAVSR
jgi:hypothetical protein